LGLAYRVLVREIGPDEIFDYRFRKDRRLTTSPFKYPKALYRIMPPRYPSRAVKWKGLNDFRRTKIEVTLPKLAAINPQVAGALKTATTISKAFSGVKGTVEIDGMLFPKKAIEQKRWMERPDLIAAYKSNAAEAKWAKPSYPDLLK
jgi:hypothetical protein